MNLKPYDLPEEEFYKILIQAERDLLNGAKIKLERTLEWRNKHLQNVAGLYAIFEQEKLVYVGETGNLRKRMSDITRTVNHSFRKQIGARNFSGLKSSKKFDDDIELLLDQYFDEQLHVSFIEVNFGRLEIEAYLIDKFHNQLINSPKKRKFNYNYEMINAIMNTKN